jgi:hypothetical protein
LVVFDGTIIKIKLLEPSYWQQRTVCAPQIPAEGVRVEPYEEGQFYIWRADLDEEYPITPVTAADRQRYAEGGSEPAARAEESIPEQAPPAEPPSEPKLAPPTEPEVRMMATEAATSSPESEPTPSAESSQLPQVELMSSSAPEKRSRRKTVYRSGPRERARAVLGRIFEDHKYPTEDEVVWADLWVQIGKEYAIYAKTNPSKLGIPSKRTFRRELGWE